MKFIEISKARGLETDQPVFTLNSDGEYGLGKLIKEEKTKDGIVRTFEVAYFYSDPPSLKTTTNITHVCIIKNKADVVQQ